jgi:type IV pilus assembly protein PilE
MHSFHRPLRHASGVTMIELMIVVAIISIIAAVSFPMYTDHVRKGHRATAQSHMMDMASRQGEILADSHTYATQTEMAGILPNPASITKYYKITMTSSAAPPKFEITATPVAGTKQVADGVLKLDYAGVKTPADKW